LYKAIKTEAFLDTSLIVLKRLNALFYEL